MLCAKQLVKIHFLSQKGCSLNKERMAEENKLVTFIHYQGSSMVKSRHQLRLPHRTMLLFRHYLSFVTLLRIDTPMEISMRRDDSRTNLRSKISSVKVHRITSKPLISFPSPFYTSPTFQKDVMSRGKDLL